MVEQAAEKTAIYKGETEELVSQRQTCTHITLLKSYLPQMPSACLAYDAGRLPILSEASHLKPVQACRMIPDLSVLWPAILGAYLETMTEDEEKLPRERFKCWPSLCHSIPKSPGPLSSQTEEEAVRQGDFYRLLKLYQEVQ